MQSDDGKKEKRDPIQAGSRRITVSGRRWRFSGRMANPDLVKMRETTFEDHVRITNECNLTLLQGWDEMCASLQTD